MVEFVRIMLWLAAVYLAAGGLFAVTFQWRGIGALDPAAGGAGFAFRLLITPGVIALWPLLAGRWFRALKEGRAPEAGEPVSPRQLRAFHALAWKMLALLVPLAVAAALWNRPPENPPSRLPLSRTEGQGGSVKINPH